METFPTDSIVLYVFSLLKSKELQSIVLKISDKVFGVIASTTSTRLRWKTLDSRIRCCHVL